MDASPDAAQNQEALWLRQTAQGDRAAFERLFRAYEHRLYRYVLGIVRTPAVAEEITGDVMLEVWRNASRFREQSKVSTWVFGIAHHKAVDALRRRAPANIELQELAGVHDRARGPEEVAIARSDARAVAEALDELSPEHRAVLELTFTYGLSQAEIARIVGCPVNTVKTRVFYAKAHLRKILDDKGVRREM
jgi:RNA polymerase sigma-70 factor, ECF subfamily